MLYVRIAAAILLLLSCRSLATLDSDNLPQGNFIVPKLQKTGVGISGPEAKRQVFQKYGWQLPEELQKFRTYSSGNSHDRAQGTVGRTGKVNAIPSQYHSEYLCRVKIGGQALDLNFDTGSADLWVFSPYLPATETAGHAVYDPTKSSTYVNASNYHWSITYGDGSGASGIVGFDRVRVGGPTVTRQAVEMATSISPQFARDANSDGLLGLAFSSINVVTPDRQTTWFDNIKSKLARAVFAVNLNEDGSGFYEFGHIDHTSYAGSLTTVAVDPDRGYWEFASPTVQISGTTIYNVQNSPAIADTGTTLLIVDDSIATYYYSNVENAVFSNYYHAWIYPCSQAASLPTFAVSMGGQNFTLQIPTPLLTYGAVDVENCYGAIQNNGGNSLQIYGDILFRSGFIVFEDYRHIAGTDQFVGLKVGLKG